jgi:hypothetical protein
MSLCKLLSLRALGNGDICDMTWFFDKSSEVPYRFWRDP